MPKLIHLLEFVQGQTGLTVDRANGVIHNIKIVGCSSPNTHGVRDRDGKLVEGTDYTMEALEEERKLLEGINVNLNHPPKDQPDKVRDCNDRFAWLSEIKLRPGDGNFGDLHFLNPEEPLAVRMMNAAEKKPDAFVLSHNAMGAGEVVNRRWRVTRVPKVNSVDIVTDGGTNRSMLESREIPMKKKFRETFGDKAKLVKLFESLTKSKPGRKRCAKNLRRLLEMDEYGAMEVEAPETDPTAAGDATDQDWKHHLGMLCASIIKDEGMSPEEKCKKIVGAVEELLKEEKEVPAEESEEEDDEEGDEMTKEKKNAVKESRELKEKVAALEKKGLVQAVLLESRIFNADDDLTEALMGLPTKERMTAFLTKHVSGNRTVPREPKSQAQGTGQTVVLKESKEGDKGGTANGETPKVVLGDVEKLARQMRSWN